MANTYLASHPMLATTTADALESWLRSVTRGGTVAALLVGPRGGGQDEAAESLAQAALADGFVVARASGRHEPQEYGLTARLMEAIGGPQAAAPAQEQHSHRFRALLAARTGRPVLVLAEHAEHMPPGDLALLLGLAFDSPRAPVLILLTAQEDAPVVAGQILPEMERSRTAHVLRLRGLTTEEVDQAAAALLPGEVASPRFVRDLLALTGGRPSYVREVLTAMATLPVSEQRHLLSGSRVLDELEVRAQFAEVLRAPVVTLDEDSQRVAEALAVWGDSGTCQEIAYLQGQDPQEVEPALDRLERAGIVSAETARSEARFTFVEPLTRLVVAAGVPSLARQRLHRRSAEMVERASAREASVQRAEHYLGGLLPLTRERVECVADAAHLLIDRSRYASARGLLDRLLQGLGADTSEVADLAKVVPVEVLVLLGESLSRAGDWQAAAAMLSVVADDPALGGDKTVPGILRLARDRVTASGHREALQLYRSFMDRAPDLEPRHQARLLIDVSFSEGSAGDRAVALNAAQGALEAATRAGDPALITEALISNHIVYISSAQPNDALPHIREALRHAHAAGNVRMVARAMSGVGNALCDAHSLTRGVRWIRRAHRLAEEGEDYATVSWTGTRLAGVSLEQGHWEEAHAVANRVAHIDATLHRPRSLRRALSLVRLVSSLRGAGPVAAADRDRPSLLGALADAEEAAAAGRPEEAYAVLAEQRSRLREVTGKERSLIHDILPSMARLSARLHDRAGVETALADLDATMEATGRGLRMGEAEIQRAQALLALVSGEPGEAGRLMEAAAEDFASLGYAWRAGQSRADAGRAWGEAGETERALVLMNEAYLALSAMGQGADTRGVASWFARMNRKPPRTAGAVLSKREIDVALLAREGLTDRAIGLELGITRRTVTTHMQRILSKLQISSRADLATELARVL